MAYEDDIRREEARKRLQARLERNGSTEASEYGSSRASRSREAGNGNDGTSSRRKSGRSAREQESARSRRRQSSDSRSDDSRSTSADRGSARSSRTSESRGNRGSSRSSANASGSPVRTILGTIGSAATRGAQAIADGYRGLYDRFGWKTLVATAVVVLLLLFLIVSGIRGCGSSGQASSSTAASTPTASTSTSASASSASASVANGSSTSASSNAAENASGSPVSAIVAAKPEIDQTTIDEDSIVNILGDDLADQLLTQAKSNNDAHWIAAHPDEYLEDGTIVRYKLLRLAAKEPLSIPFVREWPEKYCADKPDYDAAHTEKSSNGVPRLYQWDKRWGYTEYSSTTFALTGCAPTSLAMVYQAKMGNADMTPYDMGKYAEEHGYATEFDGTDGSFFASGSAGLGLSCTELGIDSNSLWQALSDGKIVVVNVGPGDFTDSGHYFVATGLADDGNVTINDPFSAERSEKTWDIDTIINQTTGLYAF